MRTHAAGRRMFHCTRCDKQYTTKSGLRMHAESMHEGVMFKCSYENCPQQFNRRMALRRHLRSHEGNFTYTCEICGRGFFTNDFFTSHMNSHYGIKAFECGLCGKKYAHSSALTRHLVDCGNERNIKCLHCDKMFQSDRQMTDHVRDVHLGKYRRFHLCSLCGKCCSDSTRLRKHMAHHAEEEKQQQQEPEDGGKDVKKTSNLHVELQRDNLLMPQKDILVGQLNVWDAATGVDDTF